MQGSDVLIRYAKPISYGIRRCEFDAYLLNRSGAHCELGVAVRRIERRDQRWIANDAYEAPLVVGAGGFFCPVARHLAAGVKTAANVVVAQEAEVRLSKSEWTRIQIDPNVPELFFCRDLRGYGWCVRKGPYLNIGLGRADTDQLAMHTQKFVKFLKHRRKLPSDFTARFVGHAYQLYGRAAPRPIGDGVVLVGDAAGLAYPLSGEGIRPAVESGLLAAQAILEADGKYHEAALQDYERRLMERFGRSRRRGVADWLPSSWLEKAGIAMMSTPWFARHVVMNRWFLHAHAPALVV
jgi:flavin-dependent dehydrogenase